MKHNKKEVVITGAGLSGLTSAWHLEENSIDYQVIEKENEVGGLVRTFSVETEEGVFRFDFTGHFLHLRSEAAKDFIKKNCI